MSSLEMNIQASTEKSEYESETDKYLEEPSKLDEIL